jgi:restriction system protein
MNQKAIELGPNKVWLGDSGWYLDLTDYTMTHHGEQISTVFSVPPERLLETTLVHLGERTPDGHLIEGPTATWFEIGRHLRLDPNFRFKFSSDPTKFEEFLAGAYKVQGWSAVTLTPRSGDKGRDIIAVTSQLSAMKVLDQAKAYSSGNLVKQNDVRALLGVLALDQNASKGVITTTSDFAPGVMEEFEKVIPYRLETKNGEQFLEWVNGILLVTANDASRPEPKLKTPTPDVPRLWPY